MAKGLVEGEIKGRIAEGGRLRNVIVVSSSAEPDAEHLAFIRPSWKRGFLPLRTWGDKEDRTYRDLDRLLVLIRQDFGYCGVVPVYVHGDPDIPRYCALAANAPSSSALLDRLENDGTPPRPDD